jgi:hypothetical protein
VRAGLSIALRRPDWTQAAWAAAVVALSLVVGLVVAAGLGWVLVVLVVSVAAVALGLRNWRWSALALLVFLPYSGLLIIAAYPQTGQATLVKDVLFVIPAYLGFGAAYLLRRRDVRIPGFPVGCLVLFAVLVVLQLANPALPNVLTGLIGAKVWLMYIPMAYLGYHLVRTREDLRRILGLICIAGVLPAIIGIVEGVLVNTGRENLVYGWYGDAAAAVTQNFAVVGEGGASISRVASTFSFVGQYFLFTMALIAASYAYWRAFLIGSRRTAMLGLPLFMLAVLAALLSGARGAILFVPAMIVVILALDGVRLRPWVWITLSAGAAAGLAIAAAVFGTSAGELVRQVWDHALGQFVINTVDGFAAAFERTIVGLGTGVDTQAARYALPELNPFAVVGGSVAESWWVKLVLELGIAGLLLGVVIIATIVVRVLAVHRRLRDPQLRSISAGLLALVLFLVVNNFKGSYIDLDPTNVLFWLFVGILLKLPELDELVSRRAPRTSPAVVEQRADVVSVRQHDLAHRDAEGARRTPAHPDGAHHGGDQRRHRGARQPERRK